MNDRPDEGTYCPLSFEAIAHSVCTRLAQNQRVRRNLPAAGRLRIDRQLPFLCVYRSPADRLDLGTRDLVTTEAAYLFTSGESRYHRGMVAMCQQIIELMMEHFGLFLLMEIWSQPATTQPAPGAGVGPEFEIVCSEPDEIPTTIDAFSRALSELNLGSLPPRVTVRRSATVCPPGMQPLLETTARQSLRGCWMLGLAIRPIYRDPHTGTLFPLLLESLRWQLASALRKTVAQFTGVSDPVGPQLATQGQRWDSYHSLGPSSLVKAAREVDQRLCSISESFDFLLQVTPINAESAWEEFRAQGYRTLPGLAYRPLPYHPSLLKRRLYATEIERIEDPTLAHLFWEKQAEIDCQLTALRDLNTSRFLYSSLQLYGGVEASLLQLASAILKRPRQLSPEAEASTPIELPQFVDRAQQEIELYRAQMSQFEAKVEVCEGIAAGVMVSHDRLLVSSGVQLTESRVLPLLHHEIGTHLLTYFNGRCQPFQQLYAGLAGYEELQEGLAVLAEYLVGGLSWSRARTLAGRVIAVEAVTRGESFAGAFAQLHEEFGLRQPQAFSTALRAYRGGGLTKDVIYLRGLRDLLDYLGCGHDIQPLYVGKIGLKHVPYVQELRRRKVIVPPRILPRFLEDAQVGDRLEAIRGMSVLQLLELC